MFDALKRQIHDEEQARRRSAAQNCALVGLLVGIGSSDDEVDIGIESIPPEGGEFKVQHLPSRRVFLISDVGITTEITDEQPNPPSQP